MLDDLLSLKKISYQEHQVYTLFHLDERGRKWVQFMLIDTFMDCVPPPAFSPEIFVFTDGRRSIIRDIKTIIDKVNGLIEEVK